MDNQSLDGQTSIPQSATPTQPTSPTPTAPVNETATPSAPASTPQHETPHTETPTDTVSQNDKIIAAICYIWIIGPIMLFLKRDSVFVTHHAKQSTGLFVAWIIYVVIGWFPLVWLFWWIVGIILIVFAIIGIIKALQGKRYMVPLIGSMSENINIR